MSTNLYPQQTLQDNIVETLVSHVRRSALNLQLTSGLSKCEALSAICNQLRLDPHFKINFDKNPSVGSLMQKVWKVIEAEGAEYDHDEKYNGHDDDDDENDGYDDESFRLRKEAKVHTARIFCSKAFTKLKHDILTCIRQKLARKITRRYLTT
eukprot:jgi/Bigna1/143347/aug1.77_g18055